MPTRFHPAQPQRGLWRELLVTLWLYFVYDMINNLSHASPQRAISRAQAILRFEQRIHVDFERSLNQWVVHHDTVALALGDFYNLAHIWVTLAFIIFLWFRRRERYPDLRNALVLCNVIGFVVFWTCPVAPPRMLPGYVDIVETTATLGSFHSGGLANAANQLAAMPSLHIAWALWVVMAILRTLPGTLWRIVAALHLIVTVIATVGTANHFVLDLVAGAATALTGFVVGRLWANNTRPLVTSFFGTRRWATSRRRSAQR